MFRSRLASDVSSLRAAGITVSHCLARGGGHASYWKEHLDRHLRDHDNKRKMRDSNREIAVLMGAAPSGTTTSQYPAAGRAPALPLSGPPSRLQSFEAAGLRAGAQAAAAAMPGVTVQEAPCYRRAHLL